MEIYETEEEQVAALKRWWKANGSAAIFGLIGGIIVVFGWNFWESYKNDMAQQSSALYDELLIAEKENKKESVDKISERLIKQFDSTAYADYAGFFLVKEKVQAGELNEAKKILRGLIESTSGELKHIARIRLIRLLLATGEYEQGLQLISEVDASDAKAFEGNYEELKGDLYVALDRVGEARTAYQNALRMGQRSPLLQYKIDDVAAPEIMDKPE